MAKSFTWNEENTLVAKNTYVEQHAAGMENSEIMEQLAEQFGTSVQSVRSKVASLKNEDGSKIYVAKARKVGGASAVRKISIVYQIEEVLGLERDSLASLEKGSKTHLETLLAELSE